MNTFLSRMLHRGKFSVDFGKSTPPKKKYLKKNMSRNCTITLYYRHIPQKKISKTPKYYSAFAPDTA